MEYWNRRACWHLRALVLAGLFGRTYSLSARLIDKIHIAVRWLVGRLGLCN